MTWNQNPSPPQTAYDDVMDRLGRAKEVSHRDPFVPAGNHDLIVASIEPFMDQKWGPSVRASLEVEQSTAAQPRTFCVKIWNLTRPSKFPTQATDADEFVHFVCTLQGVKLGEHFNHCRALIKSAREGGQLESQPARGARIKAFGTEVGKVNERGQRYVKVQWQNVPQDLATIARTRAELDARRPLGAPAAPAAPATQQYAAPDPSAYGYAPQQYAPAPTMPASGGYSAMLAPAPAVAPVTPGKPPWNPAWGPMPPGY